MMNCKLDKTKICKSRSKKKNSYSRKELENIYLQCYPNIKKTTLKKKNMDILCREITLKEESFKQDNEMINKSIDKTSDMGLVKLFKTPRRKHNKKLPKQTKINKISKQPSKKKEYNKNIEILNKKYNNINARNQFINNIINGNIKITNIKISYPYKLKKSKTLGKQLTINAPCNILSAIELLKGNVKYLSSEKGVTGYPFNICIDKEKNCKNIDNQFGIKILPYVNNTDYYDNKCINKNKNKNMKQVILDCSTKDNKRPENVESNMLYTLSSFVLHKKTPHIILPIMSFLCNIKDLLEKYRNSNLDLQDRLIDEEIYDKSVVLITEWANGGDLHRYIRKNMNNWYRINQSELIFSVIFFQLIFTLLVIYKEYPEFRHNDLKVDNVLVTEIPSGGFYLYHIDNKYYKVPNVGIQIKLWDFDLSCIRGVIDNYKTIDMDEYGIRDTKNQYYDIHCFLNFLRTYTIGKNNYNKIPDDIKNFWRRYIPIKYRDAENIPYVYWFRVIPDDEWTTPLKILRNETENYLFKPFLIDREDINSMEFIDRFNL